MQPSFILTFKPGIHQSVSDSSVVLQTPFATLDLKQFSPGMQAAIRLLCAEGTTEDSLSKLVLEKDGLNGVAKFHYYLKKFTELGIICYTLLADGFPLATIVPISPNYKFQLAPVALDKKYVWSRFAYCRKDNQQMILESPLSSAQIVLANWRGGALVSELAQPHFCRELGAKIPGISEESVQAFLGVLLASRMLNEVKNDEEPAESEALQTWEFHDLLFHTRSRAGRHSAPIGKTYRLRGKIEPLPAVKPGEFKATIPLYQPDVNQSRESDRSLTWVLEERKSIRRWGEQPITEQQLGEFLYRTARVRNIFNNGFMECSNRPYPSGGACYELELYLTVKNCDRIPPGFYRYCPQNHQLGKVSDLNHQVEKLLEEAGGATGQSQFIPQILITLAARFPRVSWAYESVAYALILKNVGVLYQTMYLVATAMNLAPSALGTGNADLFAAVAGTDYYAESSVGEFILGSQEFKTSNNLFLT